MKTIVTSLGTVIAQVKVRQKVTVVQWGNARGAAVELTLPEGRAVKARGFKRELGPEGRWTLGETIFRESITVDQVDLINGVLVAAFQDELPSTDVEVIDAEIRFDQDRLFALLELRTELRDKLRDIGQRIIALDIDPDAGDDI